MIEQSCNICVGAWPLKDHFLVDCGLTKAYVFEDQFFAGWTVLVLKEHVSELFDLSKDARGMLMEEVSHVAKTLAQVFDAKKINYELLGNQVSHIHWHLIPRLKTDPDPLKAVWCVAHVPARLPVEQLAERVTRLRAALRIDPRVPV
ncbi:MAG: HIT family protein [Nitrospirae bacterium CG_4_9_14_3_um_filter_51_5]|nr:MAG: HIT family protein [Nitrospirae bacterium CG_4_9_14_3_um_filter_51_5]